MKQIRKPDREVIDTVLSALGSAEPSADLEHRMQTFVQKSLHEQAASQPPPRARVFAWLNPSAALGSAAVLLLIAGAILYRTEYSPHAKALPPATDQAAVQPIRHAILVPDNAAMPASPPHPYTRRETHTAKFVSTSRTGTAAPQLVSYPAPSAPLTTEEKLLLRIAQSPNQQQLAMLDPVQRARDNARSDEEFEKFIHQNEMRKTP